MFWLSWLLLLFSCLFFVLVWMCVCAFIHFYSWFYYWHHELDGRKKEHNIRRWRRRHNNKDTEIYICLAAYTYTSVCVNSKET